MIWKIRYPRWAIRYRSWSDKSPIVNSNRVTSSTALISYTSKSYSARYFRRNRSEYPSTGRQRIALLSDNIRRCYVRRAYKATTAFHREPPTNQQWQRPQTTSEYSFIRRPAYSGSSLVITLCIRTVMYCTMKRELESELIGVDNDSISHSRRRSRSSFSSSSSLPSPSTRASFRRPAHTSASTYFRAPLMHARNWRGGERNARLVVLAAERAGKARFAVICWTSIRILAPAKYIGELIKKRIYAIESVM